MSELLLVIIMYGILILVSVGVAIYIYLICKYAKAREEEILETWRGIEGWDDYDKS